MLETSFSMTYLYSKGALLLKAMALYTTILSYLVGSILTGVFLGRWMDRLFDTFPLFLIIGLLLGLGGGVYGLVRLLHKFTGED